MYNNGHISIEGQAICFRPFHLRLTMKVRLFCMEFLFKGCTTISAGFLGLVLLLCFCAVSLKLVILQPLNAVMFYSVLFSSVQFSSVQFSSVQFSSVPFSSIQFSSIQFSSVQISAVQFSSGQVSSVQFSSVQFSSVQFSSVQFS